MGKRKKTRISLYLEDDELEKINEFCLDYKVDRNSFIRLACQYSISALDIKPYKNPNREIPKTIVIEMIDIPKQVTEPIEDYNYVPNDGKWHASEGFFYQQLEMLIREFETNLQNYSFKDDETANKQDYRMSKKQQQKFVDKLQQIRLLLAKK